MMLEWIYHGQHGERCYHSSNCLMCIALTALDVIRLRKRYGKVKWEMKCYVYNCNNHAVKFIELTTAPYNRLPVCRKHEREFPESYPRVKTNKAGKMIREIEANEK